MLNGKLPEGWQRNKLINLTTKITDGTHFTPTYVETGVAFISVKDIYNGKINFENCKFIPEEEHQQLIKRCFPETDDVLITKSGTIGRTAVVKTDRPFSLFVSVALLKPRKDILNSDFFAFALQNYINNIDIKQDIKGGVIKNLHIEDLKNIDISFPSISQQERIVARIEELFTQLDAGTSALAKVLAGLRRYKASVLKAAVEGTLGIQNDEFRIGEDGLPEGWRWKTVKELADDSPYSITDGPFGSNLKTEHYKESGPRVIRLQNIGDGEFRDEMAHINQEHFEALQKHRIYGGDLVIAGLGESLPRACIVPNYVGDAIVKADCIRFKPNSEISDNKYLLFALNSEPVKKLVAKVVHGVGRPRMNQQEIKAIPIPLPPLEEQRRIVAEVERRLSVARQVESAVEGALVRASRLRQAVLKSAFEGKLS